MKKNEILKILDITSYILIIIATCLVVLFEFIGNSIIMKCAMAIYFVGILALTILLSLKIYFEFSKKNKTENSSNLKETADESQADNQSQTEVVEPQTEETAANRKKRRALLITELVVSSLALILTIVLLIMY